MKSNILDLWKGGKIMEINIKNECTYEYKISLKLCESDFMKITKALKNITFQIIEEPIIGDKHYLVELNIIELKDILDYFLKENK